MANADTLSGELSQLLRDVGCSSPEELPTKIDGYRQQLAAFPEGSPFIASFTEILASAERALTLHQQLLSSAPDGAEDLALLNELKGTLLQQLKNAGIPSLDMLPEKAKQFKQTAAAMRGTAHEATFEAITAAADEALRVLTCMRDTVLMQLRPQPEATFAHLLYSTGVSTVDDLPPLIAEMEQRWSSGAQVDASPDNPRYDDAVLALRIHERICQLCAAEDAAEGGVPPDAAQQPGSRPRQEQQLDAKSAVATPDGQVATASSPAATAPLAPSESRAKERPVAAPRPPASPPAASAPPRAAGPALEGHRLRGEEALVGGVGDIAAAPSAPAATAQALPAPSQMNHNTTVEERADKAVEVRQKAPESAESSLIILENHFANLSSSCQPLSEQELRHLFVTFHEQIEREQLSGDLHKEELPTLPQVLADHRGCVECDVNVGCDTYDLLSDALKRIRPIHMDMLLANARETDRSSDVLRGQDIMLLLGGTGAGKSTTIHFLAGSRMEMVASGHIQPVPGQTHNPALAGVIPGSDTSQSETRFISAVPVAFRDLGSPRDGAVTLCDTPGFEDTSGAEVDIPNGIGIIRAARQCRTVRPVVLLSRLSIGDKSEGLLQLMRTVANLMNNLPQHLTSFSFLLTKGQTVQDIRDRASSLQKIPNVSKEVKTLLRELIRQCQEQDGRTLVREVDPVRGDPAALLEFLAGKPPIQAPERAFREYFGSKSRQKLKAQIAMYEKTIARATKRRDMPLLQYKLAQLRTLAIFLGMDDTLRVYNHAVVTLAKDIEQEMHEASKSLKTHLQDGNAAVSDKVQADLREILRLYQQCLILQDHQDVLSAQAPENPVSLATRCLNIVRTSQSTLGHLVLLALEGTVGLQDAHLGARVTKMAIIAGERDATPCHAPAGGSLAWPRMDAVWWMRRWQRCRIALTPVPSAVHRHCCCHRLGSRSSRHARRGRSGR